MTDHKKTRTELKELFVENSIPTADDFAALIDAGLNQTDDQVDVTAGRITVDAIAAKTADGKLTLSGNGAGGVEVSNALTVTGALTASGALTANGGLSVNHSGPGNAARFEGGNGVDILANMAGYAFYVEQKGTGRAAMFKGGSGVYIFANTTADALYVDQNGTGNAAKFDGKVVANGLVTASAGLTVSAGSTSVATLSASGLVTASEGLTAVGLLSADTLRSRTSGTTLMLSGNGSGGVEVDNWFRVGTELYVNSIAAKTTNAPLKLRGNGAGGVEVSAPLTVANALDVNGTIMATGAISAGTLVVDTITAKTAGGKLTLSGQGNGAVEVNDPLTVTGTLVVDTITAKTAGGKLTLSGQGSGAVEVNDPLTVTGALTASSGLSVRQMTTTKRGLDLEYGARGLATNSAYHPTDRPLYVSGVTDSKGAEFRGSNGLRGISIGETTIQAVGTTTNADLVLAGKGTGVVVVKNSLTVDNLLETNSLTVTGTATFEGGFTIEPWKVLPLGGGWGAWSAVSTPKYLKDPMGFVRFMGRTEGVTTGVGRAMLPTGYRPKIAMRFCVPLAGGSTSSINITVSTSGELVSSSNSGVCLDGVSFLAEN